MMRIMHVAALWSLLVTAAAAEVVVDFDELTGYTNSGASGSYFNGYGFGAQAGGWSSQGVTFNTREFGPGWSYSNVDDNSTAGFSNQFASFTGLDFGGGGNYVIGNANSPNGAYFNLPGLLVVQSIQVANSTYAALSMRDGDSFAKKFGGPSGSESDFFRLTFTGFSQLDLGGNPTGTAEFFLSDFRFADDSLDYILDQWAQVDLAGLGFVRSVGISLDSTDNGEFGMNTPAYVAFDDLVLTAVPEPGSLILLTGIGLGAIVRQRRRRRVSCSQDLHVPNTRR